MDATSYCGKFTFQIGEIIGLFETRDEKALGGVGLKWETCLCGGRHGERLNGVCICSCQLRDAFGNDDLLDGLTSFITNATGTVCSMGLGES